MKYVTADIKDYRSGNIFVLNNLLWIHQRIDFQSYLCHDYLLIPGAYWSTMFSNTFEFLAEK